MVALPTPPPPVTSLLTPSPRSIVSQGGRSNGDVELLETMLAPPPARPSEFSVAKGSPPAHLLTDTMTGYPASMPPPSAQNPDPKAPHPLGLRYATRRKLQAFYQAHPRYAEFAAKHPHLNKWLLVGTTAFALIAPTVAIRSGIGHIIRGIEWWPKPKTALQTLGWMAGITLGFTGLGVAVNRFSKPTPTAANGGLPGSAGVTPLAQWPQDPRHVGPAMPRPTGATSAEPSPLGLA